MDQYCSLLTLRTILIYEVCRKCDKNCIKNSKNRKFWVFCHFRFQFETFFIQKIEIIFSEKPTGQLIRATLTVFNILVNEVCRKFDKNCLKLLKIRKFWNICHFWGLFFGTKSLLSLHRRLLENEFVPC